MSPSVALSFMAQAQPSLAMDYFPLLVIELSFGWSVGRSLSKAPRKAFRIIIYRLLLSARFLSLGNLMTGPARTTPPREVGKQDEGLWPRSGVEISSAHNFTPTGWQPEGKHANTNSQP